MALMRMPTNAGGGGSGLLTHEIQHFDKGQATRRFSFTNDIGYVVVYPTENITSDIRPCWVGKYDGTNITQINNSGGWVTVTLVDSKTIDVYIYNYGTTHDVMNIYS